MIFNKIKRKRKFKNENQPFSKINQDSFIKMYIQIMNKVHHNWIAI